MANSQYLTIPYLLVEGFVVLLIFGELFKEFEALLNQILSDNLQDFGLLKSFTRNVQGQVLGVDHTLDKVQKLWDELITVIHDEDTSHVQLDRVLLFFVLEQIEWRALWDEQKCAEFKLTFNRKVFDCQMIFPIVSQALVEFRILLVGDIIWVTSPDWFSLKNIFF